MVASLDKLHAEEQHLHLEVLVLELKGEVHLWKKDDLDVREADACMQRRKDLRPGYPCGMPFVYTASVPAGCPFGV